MKWAMVAGIRTVFHLPPVVIKSTLSVLVQNVDNNFDLVLWMCIRGNPGNTDVVDVIQAHVQVLGNVVVGAARDEAQFEFSVIDSHGIGVEGIIGLTDQVELGPDVKLPEGLATIPVTEAGDVEVVQVDFLDDLVFSCSHKALSFR